MSPERWQQIARLFDEVLERGPDERAAFLDAACAQDRELRREVESLLAARHDAGEFLDQSALELEARRVATATVIPAGQHIAHFEVLAPLGAGAMGEVYLARDTRLARKVALKLLPDRFTLDAGRLRRFAREARAASALSHPNIITVYEVGQDGARHYLAAEYVEGVTLRQRLAAGPLDIAVALDLASQIAAALESAHQAGIVHRDIKPENVMVRPDGVVKVLDFGIAKLTERADTGMPVSHGTEQGTVIGTPGYMSPEQARGLEVDARTDIFSLGVVLYEMIAGQLPFRGTTSADAIVALLELEPARLSGHNPTVAPALDRLVERLLAKERTARYSTLAEVQRDLQSCQPTSGRVGVAWRKAKQRLGALTGTAARPNLARASRNNRFLLAASFLGVVGVVALGWLLYRSSRKPEIWADRSQLHIAPFISKKIGLGGGLSRLAFAPDGQAVAYSMSEEGSAHLWIKSVVTEVETKITAGQWKDIEPVWSPDGRRLAFLSNRAGGPRDLWVMALDAPQPTLLKKIELLNPRLVVWGKSAQSERIYFEAEHNLYALDPVSAELAPLTKLEQSLQVAEFSLAPKLDQVVYLGRAKGEVSLMLHSLLTGATTMLWQERALRSPVWFPDGRKLAFCSNRTGAEQVYVLWLNERRLEQVTFSNDSYGALAVSPDGNTLAARVTLENANLFARAPGSPVEEQHSFARGVQVLPESAPAGDRLIFQSANTSAQDDATIFIKPAGPTEPAARLTTGLRGRWSPDGATLAFLRRQNNETELWRLNLRNQQEARLAGGLLMAPNTPLPYALAYAEFAWAPDNARLVYSARQAEQSNLWQVAADGTPPVKLTANTDPLTTLYAPCWSPQPQRLAYLSETRPAKLAEPTRWRLHVLDAGKASVVLERAAVLRLLGWTAAGQELLIAEAGGTQQLALWRVALRGGQARRVGQLPTNYLNSLALDHSGKTLAYLQRREGVDSLMLFSLDSGRSTLLTSNADTGTRYATLRWDATGSRLFYSKQEYRQEVQFIIKTPAR